MPDLLEISGLTVGFRGFDGTVDPVVRDVTFSVGENEVVAVVGESGSGKSVTALSIARLLPEPPAVALGGCIRWKGRDVATLSAREMRSLRGREVAYVFQEPSAALNPVFTVGSQLGEVVRLHRPEVGNVDEEVVGWLRRVGIREPGSRLGAYPHELSGGMQQRVVIAMAMIGRPALLVADEPTTALDVTVQRRILDLMADLRREFGTAILMITHNFSIIRGFADRVVVMWRGQVVEAGPTDEVLGNPGHPYTRALIDCVPRIGRRRRRLPTIDAAVLEAECRAGVADRR